jgi:tetratricopeptide (TPR) repeat protein
VSDLLVGLLAAALSTNPPLAVSNLVAEKTGVSVPIVNTNDPVESEYYKILLDDDAAEKDVLNWTENAEAFAKAGGDDRRLTLHLRIEQRLDRVRREYEDFVQRHPKHVNAHLAYGSFLNDTKDEDGAIAQWEAARQLAPTNPAPWNNLANIYGHHGPILKAFEYYDKAIELDPNQAVYYQNLATTVYLFRVDASNYYHLSENEVFDKSLGLYRKAIELAPDDFVLFTDYAESYYGIKPPRWKEGLEAWTEALKVAHSEVEREGVYIHLARFNLKLGQFDAARQDLSMVTNDMYLTLKKRVTRNLAEAIVEAATNAPAMPPAAKVRSGSGNTE